MAIPITTPLPFWLGPPAPAGAATGEAVSRWDPATEGAPAAASGDDRPVEDVAGAARLEVPRPVVGAGPRVVARDPDGGGVDDGAVAKGSAGSVVDPGAAALEAEDGDVVDGGPLADEAPGAAAAAGPDWETRATGPAKPLSGDTSRATGARSSLGWVS